MNPCPDRTAILIHYAIEIAISASKFACAVYAVTTELVTTTFFCPNRSCPYLGIYLLPDKSTCFDVQIASFHHCMIHTTRYTQLQLTISTDVSQFYVGPVVISLNLFFTKRELLSVGHSIFCCGDNTRWGGRPREVSWAGRETMWRRVQEVNIY